MIRLLLLVLPWAAVLLAGEALPPAVQSALVHVVIAKTSGSATGYVVGATADSVCIICPDGLFFGDVHRGLDADGLLVVARPATALSLIHI